jgi:hypothetical protein
MRMQRNMLAVAISAAGLAVALVGAAPAEQAHAQHDSGSSINLGGSISGTVTGAVSGIATTHGGSQTSHNEMYLGDQEGLAISDASGGNYNVGAEQK